MMPSCAHDNEKDAGNSKFTHYADWRMEERLPHTNLNEDTNNSSATNKPLQTGLVIRQPL